MNQKFKQNFIELFGISEKEFDEIYSAPSYRGIRINSLKSNFETVQKSLNFPLTKTKFHKDGYYIPSDFKGIGNLPLHHAGAFYVQEPSASSVLSVLDAEKGQKVLDLCAAPGGKSTGIGADLLGEGILWSNEYVRKRAGALLSNIERMGIHNASVSSLSADYLCAALEGFFDIVLVDAPCSGEGMWRHNDLVEEQWSEEYVEECAERQFEILSSAAKAVKSGGRLVYSTCTFNLEENEKTVSRFLKSFKNFSLKKITNDFGRGGLLGEKEIDQKVKRISQKDLGEGHFVALFERENDGNFFCGETVKENIGKADKKLVEEFLKENFDFVPSGVLVEKNGFVYLVPKDMPQIKGDILRQGLFVGEIRKQRLIPEHSLFSAAAVKPKRVLNLSVNDERITQFLKGLEISAENGEDGFTAVFVEGAPLGFGKVSGGKLKNKYPKGLRLV